MVEPCHMKGVQKQPFTDALQNRLEILHNSQENTCVGVNFLIRLQA